MNVLLKDALPLYRECFKVYGEEDELILGYAAKHGKIHILRQDGLAVSMICTAEITDGNFKAQYIFAVCTKPEYRNRGLFRNHFETVIGETPSLLIPENENLFGFYERFGYKPLHCLEAEINGQNKSKAFDGSFDELYEIYNTSFQFPKKDIRLFKAAINAHTACGGEVKRFGSCVFLIDGGTVTDVFAATAETAVQGIMNACGGRFKAILPPETADELQKNGIKFRKKKIAMGRNIPSVPIYINTLFN